jgi:hypothetical protein
MLKEWGRGKLKEEEDPLPKWFLLLEAKGDQKIARALEGKAMKDAADSAAIIFTAVSKEGCVFRLRGPDAAIPPEARRPAGAGGRAPSF